MVTVNELANFFFAMWSTQLHMAENVQVEIILNIFIFNNTSAIVAKITKSHKAAHWGKMYWASRDVLGI